MKSILCILSFLLVLPGVASAETVIRTGDSISIANDQSIANDFYALAESISMSGEVAGDMYAVGAVATINGAIDEDLTLVAGSAHVHAPVADDVRIIGGEIIIADNVAGDLFVIGGVLKVLSTASVGGDVYFFGGDAVIEGAVTGSVIGNMERLEVAAPIGGAVDVVAFRGVTLSERSQVAGDVVVESSVPLSRAQSALIGGEVIQNTPAAAAANLRDIIIPILVSLCVTLCLYALFRPWLQRYVERTLVQYARHGLVGIGALVLVPMVIVILLFTVLGLVLGLLGLFTFLATLVVASVLVNVLLGALCAYVFTKKWSVDLLWVVVGTITTHVLLLIPVIGPILVFGLFVIALGSLYVSSFTMVAKGQ